ncbi:hypothetical protein [Phaeobacter sp. C3_T13_0]|uniref:hypothetical protein n=1 Tax=Phaeobacter cretensis TaxID=3342641 RepID=UPI0039BD6A95
MTALDVHSINTANSHSTGGSAPILAAAALLILLGVPALLAPASNASIPDWHGNSATTGIPH